MIKNSGPLKAVDPIVVRASSQETSKMEANHEPLNKDSNESKKLNETNSIKKTKQTAIKSKSQNQEDDQQQTKSVPEKSPPEVFGSLVSLNEFVPSTNRDQ